MADCEEKISSYKNLQYHLSSHHDLDDVSVMLLCRPTRKPISILNNNREKEFYEAPDQNLSSFETKVIVITNHKYFNTLMQ